MVKKDKISNKNNIIFGIQQAQKGNLLIIKYLDKKEDNKEDINNEELNKSSDSGSSVSGMDLIQDKAENSFFETETKIRFIKL